MTSPYTAALIIIGNEILSGRTQDSNTQFLAKELNALGIRLQEVRVIPDIEAIIIATVHTLKTQFDYIFTTGGIGPTHDDITSEAMAKAFAIPLILHEEARRRLASYYAEGDLNEARLKMAYIPEGAALIDNPVSSAPGFMLENVYVMAGVPRIMQAMFHGIKHTLKGGKIVESRDISVYLPEGAIAQGFAELQKHYPAVEMGSYPFIHQGRLGTSLVLRSEDIAQLEDAFAKVAGFIDKLGGEIRLGV